MQQADEVKAEFQKQIDQSQLKKKLAELANAPIHITYEMFLAIMTTRLKVTLSDKDLKKAFKLFDRDGSGSLDAAEFRHVLENLADHFTKEEIDEMVAQADVDGNGTIGKEEMMMMLMKLFDS